MQRAGVTTLVERFARRIAQGAEGRRHHSGGMVRAQDSPGCRGQAPPLWWDGSRPGSPRVQRAGVTTLVGRFARRIAQGAEAQAPPLWWDGSRAGSQTRVQRRRREAPAPLHPLVRSERRRREEAITLGCALTFCSCHLAKVLLESAKGYKRIPSPRCGKLRRAVMVKYQ